MSDCRIPIFFSTAASDNNCLSLERHEVTWSLRSRLERSNTASNEKAITIKTNHANGPEAEQARCNARANCSGAIAKTTTLKNTKKTDAFQNRGDAFRMLFGCFPKMYFGLGDALGMLCGCSADAFPKSWGCPRGVESSKKSLLLDFPAVGGFAIVGSLENTNTVLGCVR